MRRKAPSPEALGGIITTSYGPNRAPVGLTRARASGEQSPLSPYPGPLAPHGSSVRYPWSVLIIAHAQCWSSTTRALAFACWQAGITQQEIKCKWLTACLMVAVRLEQFCWCHA